LAIRPIVTVPHPVLKQRAKKIHRVDDSTRQLIQDLIDTVESTPNGAGLAAPQIGVPLRLIAVDVTDHPKATVCHGPMVIVNPEVVTGEGSEIGREGCLSLPSITADVRRATRIFVKGFTLGGDEVSAETSGFEARAIQHEVDHLDGILILDRVASPAEIFPRRQKDQKNQKK